jgi:hypothetical protein
MRVLPLKIALGVFHATFEWRQHGRFFGTLHRGVSVHDAARDGCISPERSMVCSIKQIAGGMIEVIVGIERSFYRDLSYATESIHLERSSRGADKALQQKRAVFSGKKAAVARKFAADCSAANDEVPATKARREKRREYAAIFVSNRSTE